MKLVMHAHTGNLGMEYTSFLLKTQKSIPPTEADAFSCQIGPAANTVEWPVLSIERNSEGLLLICKPFPSDTPFALTASLEGRLHVFTNKDISETLIQGLDRFEALQENNVLYRLYSPTASAPRPLILFLHGGGECGYDNVSQMTGIFGAIHLSELYPDLFIMAPQAPGLLADMMPDKDAFYHNSFTNFYQPKGTGWHREYLGAVCDIIRRMILEKKVDENRIYVTGASMGGAGTLRALSVGAGLFAAAAPVCPTMIPETYHILCSLTDAKIWISTAYTDHTIYRHKYIVDAVMKLKASGNKNVHLTLYAPEELEKYGLSTALDMPLLDKLSENHHSWILTYHNEYGIMDWLVSQHK